MVHEQEIWLSPRATAFTAVCDECLSEQAVDGYVGATVTGRLRLEDERGWAECARGHRIRVFRAEGTLAGVIR